MQITILGKGNMGAPLAELACAAGHSVASLGSQDDARAAIAAADVVFLAMKYEQAVTFAGNANTAELLRGKIVVDITNPLAADFMSLTVGHDSSGGEEIAKALSGASVIKAFNAIFASVLADHAGGKTTSIPIFVAGDDETAKDKVLDLVRDMGLEAIDGGALSNARYLEPMTEMMIQLGYGLGHGDRIGFVLQKAA
jgi:predicted dinucleotide-binding enzyme